MDDPNSPHAISGMPYAIKRQLQRLGHEVVDLLAAQDPVAVRLRRSLGRQLPHGVRRSIKQTLTDPAGPLGFVHASIRRLRRPESEDAVYVKQLARARALSRNVQRRIAAQDPPLDVLVGVCISVPLYALEVEQPIVYFSDMTARIMLETYPLRPEERAGWRRAAEEFERVALSRTARAAFATDLACRSAVQDFGMDAARVFRIPLGANVVPESALVERALALAPPSRDDLRMVITAADPRRKRLDLAIDAVDALRREGIGATLTYIGPPTERAAAHPHVRCAGRLMLSEPADRRRNLELLAESHVMILPSLGEAFGIAVAEAAHLGKPSVVSDAGGLPEVVEHGRTGTVLPVNAGAADYAAAIRDLCLDPARYAAFSAAALERARSVLHWDRFGETLGRLVEEAVQA